MPIEAVVPPEEGSAGRNSLAAQRQRSLRRAGLPPRIRSGCHISPHPSQRQYDEALIFRPVATVASDPQNGHGRFGTGRMSSCSDVRGFADICAT